MFSAKMHIESGKLNIEWMVPRKTAIITHHAFEWNLTLRICGMCIS